MTAPLKKIMMFAVPLLWAAALASAAGAIYSKHRARELFVELERLNVRREQVGQPRLPKADDVLLPGLQQAVKHLTEHLQSADPAIRLAGGRCIHLPLQAPDFRIDWDRVRATLSSRTRLIIINNPHNPACSVLTAQDLDALAELVRGRSVFVLADEVYEHVLYDGRRHQSVMNHPELRDRSFAVYSFGKTLHITGWRVGYCVAAAPLTRELRKVHQFNTFSIAAPLQAAITLYLQKHPQAFREVAGFFSAKRALLMRELAGSGLALPPAQGSYFQLADYGRIPAFAALDDVQFTEKLINEAGVAVIPLSPFYREPPAGMRIVRLCVAKRDETLTEAARRIRAYTSRH